MTSSASHGLVIKTSSPGWMTLAAKAYQSKTSFTLSDDARLGVDPVNETLFQMGRKADLSQREWIAVGTSIGMSTVGIALLTAAVLDPEPFSKIGFVLAAGGLLVAGGGYAAIRVLVGHPPPNISVTPKGFEIKFS